MGDVIRGTVTGISDGDVIIIELSGLGEGNVGKYNNIERVFITGSESIEAHAVGGQRTKEYLEKNLKGKIIMCYIEGRDEKKRLKASIKVI